MNSMVENMSVLRPVDTSYDRREGDDLLAQYMNSIRN
jgi:hypothetical protein